MNQLFTRDTCPAENDYNGENWGARISSVFVILIASGYGAFFPILSSKYSFIRLPSWCFFITKYFGSGVIVATAFIHLLQPANQSLSTTCLASGWLAYPWAFAFCLITLFMLFFFEICAFHLIDRKFNQQHSHSHFGNTDLYVSHGTVAPPHIHNHDTAPTDDDPNKEEVKEENYEEVSSRDTEDMESYYPKLLSVFVLEFGVIFHSVFVGLSLAVAGSEFKSLYVVLVFHQLFEGLGLGTRIATTPWPANKRKTPYLLALGYMLTTPIAVAVGLGVRTTYPPGSARSLVTNGIFDSISSGILIYTGIVELMAYEFLYSGEFNSNGARNEGANLASGEIDLEAAADDGKKFFTKDFKRCMAAYFIMCTGVGLMALLGKWA